MQFRGMRAVTSFLILLILIFYGRSINKRIKLHLLLYGLSSVFTIWYENEWAAVASLVLSFLAMLASIWEIFPRLVFKRMHYLIVSALLAVSIINGWLLYSFIDILSQSINSYYIVASIYLSTGTFFILTVLAFIYYNEANTSTSLVFVFYLIFLIFAEVFRGAGYYQVIDSVLGQYFARVLLVTATLLLYHYSLLKVKGVKI
ncbi:MAG: hypothetical protein AAFP76_09625 [Bacteroidota bacterium]